MAVTLVLPSALSGAGRGPDAAAKSVRHAHDKEFRRRPVTPGEKTRRKDLREQRRRRQHGCWDQLIVAPLWVAYEANLGTLLRTCDAVGACMAVPNSDHYRRALDRGDTLPRRPHVHWVRRSKLTWIAEQRATSRIVAVELAEDATPLCRLAAARTRTVILLGHEHHGVPAEAWDFIDEVVEIPMVGRGAGLNVAVAGSLALYRLAGLM